ncbi:MAG: CBS domain-containing protein [Proteobacteria bacterium]|nr:CBS domain-containing protein [Pseudomonadota bacterium]
MQAKDVMTRKVVTVTPATTVEEVAKLLLEKRVSAVPVVDSAGGVVGMVSEGDLIGRPETGGVRRRSWWLAFLGSRDEKAAMYAKTHGRRAGDVMTTDVVSVGEDADVGAVAEILEERHVKRVPVIAKGKLLGVVSRSDLVRGLAARERTKGPAVSAPDSELRTRVLKALDKSGISARHLVNVTVVDGVVHLWGLVESAGEREALRVAAENTPGVRGVKVHLGTVVPWAWAD